MSPKIRYYCSVEVKSRTIEFHLVFQSFFKNFHRFSHIIEAYLSKNKTKIKIALN